MMRRPARQRMAQRSMILRVLVLGLLVAGLDLALFAQEPPPGDELSQLLATLKRKADDISLAIGQRESIVQEMAGALDRAAQRSPGADQKQARWSQAIDLLDAFRGQNTRVIPELASFSFRRPSFAGPRGRAGGSSAT